MKIVRITHWIGVASILASFLLLLIATLSAPFMNRNSFLRVTIFSTSIFGPPSITFGTFGFCIENTLGLDINSQQDLCSSRHIGYAPSNILTALENESLGKVAEVADGLTGIMVLHPIACGVAFASFLVSIGAGLIGSLIGSLLAILAWIFTLVAMAADFTVWGLLRHHINNDNSGSRAEFGASVWCVVAAFVFLFFGQAIVLFTCFSTRRERRNSLPSNANRMRPGRRRRFGLF